MKKYEKLDQFFERVKNLGFWQRIFSWRLVQSLSYEAFEEYKNLIHLVVSSEEQLATSSNKIDLLNNDNSHIKSESVKLQSSLDISNTKLTSVETALSAHKAALASREETIKQSDKKIIEQQAELKSLKEKHTSVETMLSSAEATLASREENIKQSEKKAAEQQAELKSSKENARSLQEELAVLKEENAIFKSTENDRNQSYETKIATLGAITSQVQKEREVEKQKNLEKEIQRLTAMKETWARHQASVQEAIKMICQKHTIEYIDQVPFKGKPDNTIQISDEYIIFDAKSPSSDDLKNFPIYIKTQTESVKKYIKEANVRKDIFLVIPSNAVDVIDNFSFNMADYNVYVVTIDVLEPLILALRKIEDYEFVEQLTPEDRENICRIIGKFAHITKRKIQVDFFFTKELMGVLKKCEANLPSDIMGKVVEYEKSEKINPPREARSKQILTKELEVESETIQSSFKGLPLNENDETVPSHP
jgi:myosin heavy subunit